MRTQVLAVSVALAGCGRMGFTERDGTTVDAAVDAAPDAAQTNLMFVTSTAEAGAVCTAGPASADAVCATRAMDAGLPGTYRAWMSGPGEHARDRLGSARGWLRTDGRPFADTVASMISGQVIFPGRFTELGVDIQHGFTQTATAADGTHSTASGCSVGGLTGSAGTRWASGIVVSNGRLYCFGIDHATPVSAPRVSGRVAFVSTQDWPPSSGIAAADAICAADATSGGQPGTYRAFLPTTTASAASRFDLGGAIWVRPDGVPIVTQASDLASWTLLAPIMLHADGSPTQLRVWT
ncbi:MAG: hypothetical protein H0T42_32575, partial [Deltaproteobacteria bacterium]|nr:hypothetical protein [Deltaproteobacteria bacterium]